MDFWFTLILIIDVLVAMAIVGLVLLQHGKGADVGAAFGSGASGSLFGASGSANFLSRSTAVLAVVFFITTFTLAYLASHRPRGESAVIDSAKEQPAAPPAPAAGGETAPKAPATSEPKANEVPK
jgi:preprotein translocase subunit SecG